MGSSKAQVLAAQGNPDRTDDKVQQKWFYGSAWVQFNDDSAGGAVIGWNNTSDDLTLVVLGPNASEVSLGSSKAQVLAAQGNPDRTDDKARQKWLYGSAWVQFDDDSAGGAVIGWNNTSGVLNLAVLGPEGSEVGLGSSKAQVLAAGGNPDRTDDKLQQKWFYGSGWVQFDDDSAGGAVIGWGRPGGQRRLSE